MNPKGSMNISIHKNNRNSIDFSHMKQFKNSKAEMNIKKLVSVKKASLSPS